MAKNAMNNFTINTAKNNAKLYDPTQLIQAGINPKNGLPIKMGEGEDATVVGLRRILTRNHLQQFMNRFKWTDLPAGYTGQMIERMLYYKGQLCLFYLSGKFYILPFAYSGENGVSLDVNGLATSLTPVPYNGGVDKDGHPIKWIAGERKILRQVVLPEDVEFKDIENFAVILFDSSPQESPNACIPRIAVDETMINLEVDTLLFAQTAATINSGVRAWKVGATDEQSSVAAANQTIKTAARKCQPFIAVQGGIEWQNLCEGSTYTPQDFLLLTEAFDNFRLESMGLGSGSLLQKKEHMLQAEQQANIGAGGLIFDDNLAMRQQFCTWANSLFGTHMWCEENATAQEDGIENEMVLEDNESKTAFTGGESENDE